VLRWELRVTLVLLHWVNNDLLFRGLQSYITPIEQLAFVNYNYNGNFWDLSWIGVSEGATG
jgi:hypothetical protein